MRRCDTPWPRRASPGPLFVGFLLITPLALAGCVTRGTYQEAVDERDELKQKVELLQASNESLGSERVKIIEEMETLREAKTALDHDVNSLRKHKAELTSSLEAREAELSARNQEVEQLKGTYQGLVSDLESEVAAGQIQIQQLREGLQLNMAQDVLFASGSPELNEAGRSVLSKVAQRLKEIPHQVEVRGHTDSVPIRSGRFPSNWELAGARASGVVRYLAEHEVDPHRLVSVSYGEYVPIATNETPEGRQKNRRIEIALEPMQQTPSADATPSAKPAPAKASAAP